MSNEPPAITGPQLIRLLLEDGWDEKGRSRHGKALVKVVDGRKTTVVIPTKRSPLPRGTLAAILGPKQSQLGRDGLLALMGRHGLS